MKNLEMLKNIRQPLSVEQEIKRLADNGGVIQINFASYFVDQASKDTKAPIDADVAKYIKDNNLEPTDYASYDDYRREQYDKRFLYVSSEKVADHIDHVVNLVGIDHVGFGSDCAGALGHTPSGCIMSV